MSSQVGSLSQVDSHSADEDDVVHLDGEYWDVECSGGNTYFSCDTDPADGDCDAYNTFGGPSCQITHVKPNTETA